MKETTHPLVIALLDKLEARIPEVSSGTYNKQDPTAYSVGKDNFKYRNTELRIEYHDCTWGREFHLYIYLYTKDESKWVLVSNWYYDHKCFPSDKPTMIKRSDWHKGTYLILQHYCKITEEIDHNYYEDCPHGCPQDYI